MEQTYIFNTFFILSAAVSSTISVVQIDIGIFNVREGQKLREKATILHKYISRPADDTESWYLLHDRGRGGGWRWIQRDSLFRADLNRLRMKYGLGVAE